MSKLDIFLFQTSLLTTKKTNHKNVEIKRTVFQEHTQKENQS